MKTRKLGDIVSIQIGKTPNRDNKLYWGKGYPWVSISDLKEKTIHTTKEEITDLGVIECGCKLIPQGTLLMSFKLSIGKLAFSGKDLFTNEAICALTILNENEVYKEYLYYALKFTKLTGSNIAAKGATLNTPSLKALKLPFPEKYEDQIRIATILSNVETLIKKRKESIELLDDFLKSTFLKIFGASFKNSPFVSLSSLCTKITDGTHDTPERLEKGVKFITGKHIRPFIIDYLNSDYVSEDVHEEIYRRCNPEFGDILYTNIGVNLGTAAMNIADYPFSMKNVALLKPDLSKVTSRYLEHFLNNERQKNNIIRSAGSGGAQQFLSLKQIREIKIPVPPILAQTQFAQIVERVENLKIQNKNSLQELENLFASLSQKAFNGDLDLSKMDLQHEEKYLSADNQNDNEIRKPSRFEKTIAAEIGIINVESQKKLIKSTNLLGEETRNINKSSKTIFSSIKGDAILKKIFNKNINAFQFEELKVLIKNEGFEIDYSSLKDFIIEKLEKKELVQYYLDKEWLQNHFDSQKSPSQDNFAGDGNIWFLPNIDNT